MDNNLIRELEQAVGPEYVSASPDVCRSYAYSCFLGSKWVTLPEIVVLPQNTLQVSEVIKLANKYKVPVTPKGLAGGTGHGGPLHGGILLELSNMDKILSIDTVNMKAVAEAGCSFFKLSQELFKKGMMLPTTEYGPGPNVAASAITPVNAFGKTRYGRNVDLVEGFEVVLPEGEIITVGSMAYDHTDFGPFYRFIHGPDLMGLFVMSNGAYGIVTKVAYSCLALPAEWALSAYYWPEDQIQDVTNAMIDAVKLEIFDVHCNDKWKIAPVEELTGQSLLPPDAYFILNFMVNAGSKEELESKQGIVEKLCAKHNGKKLETHGAGFFDEWPTFFTPVANFTCDAIFSVMYKLSKANYMYIYDSINYPISRFPEVYGKLKEIGLKHEIWGYPRLTVYDGFPMKSQTMCSQTWAFINTRDEKWVERIYKCRDEFREWFGAKGGTHQQHLPPIIPMYAWDNQKGAHQLAKKIKGLLDPNNILSPGTFS